MTDRKWLLGIDVAGSKKGFHAAVALQGEREVRALLHSFSATDLASQLDELGITPSVIAVDCPRVYMLKGGQTRAAERQLHKRRFRVQWTRRSGEAPEWMKNGERLWSELSVRYPSASLIECFPTVASPKLGCCELALPLRLLADHSTKREWKDFVDACIAVEVASKLVAGTAQRVPEDGEEDVVGCIYF